MASSERFHASFHGKSADAGRVAAPVAPARMRGVPLSLSHAALPI